MEKAWILESSESEIKSLYRMSNQILYILRQIT